MKTDPENSLNYVNVAKIAATTLRGRQNYDTKLGSLEGKSINDLLERALLIDTADYERSKALTPLPYLRSPIDSTTILKGVKYAGVNFTKSLVFSAFVLPTTPFYLASSLLVGIRPSGAMHQISNHLVTVGTLGLARTSHKSLVPLDRPNMLRVDKEIERFLSSHSKIGFEDGYYSVCDIFDTKCRFQSIHEVEKKISFNSRLKAFTPDEKAEFIDRLRRYFISQAKQGSSHRRLAQKLSRNLKSAEMDTYLNNILSELGEVKIRP